MFQFLMGLNDATYETVCSNIIKKELVPKGKQVLAQVCKEEQHKNLSKTVAIEERGGTDIAFAAIKPRVRTTCRYCHKSAHDVENYFQLVGYPDWWLKIDVPPSATAGRGGRTSLVTETADGSTSARPRQWCCVYFIVAKRLGSCHC